MPGRVRLHAVLISAAAATVVAGAPAAAHPGPTARSVSTIEPVSIGLPFGAPRRAEPPAVPPPRAVCGPGAKPETEMQGRVSAAAIAGPAKDGYWCNVSVVSHDGRSGGFKVRRYIDKAGHECAYYDTALLFPANALNMSGDSIGVTVLDMANPAKPVHTAQLITPAMVSPHESLVVSQERGLLAAVAGNPAFAPGIVDVYDIAGDCRQPVLQSSLPIGIFGHESGFTRDGKTFYSASPSTKTVVAIDLADPKLPVVLYAGNIPSHGMSLSDDGNRAYVAAINTGSGIPSGLQIFDTSEVQARKPNPQVRQVGSLTWESVSIPQNAIPITIKGRPYVLEIDEYRSIDAAGRVGAGRIIDISDETKPRVVSNLRLAVHQPENRAALANDPGFASPVQGYAGHYCDVPTRKDPGIVACSMIASGLRVFDIRDPEQPKEVAYFVAPPVTKFENSFDGSNFAMSQPTFAPERREVWYSDGTSGFYNLRLSEAAWPGAAAAVPAKTSRLLRSVRLSRRTFGGRRSLELSYRLSAAARVTVTVLRGKKAVRRLGPASRRAGRTYRVKVSPRGLRPGRYRVRVVAVAGSLRASSTLSARKTR